MQEFRLRFTTIFHLFILDVKHMRKLAAVEEAKAIFAEAQDWGVWKWLTEKKRLRHTADAAWDALESYETQVKQSWDAATRKAIVAQLKRADAEACQARMDAEAQFDEADRRMSTSMAREGAQMAIEAWTLREKLIRKMEAIAREK
jgi:hypothetical protein